MALNLKIDDGYQEFMINGDPEKVIRFNPSDVGILARFQEAQKAIQEVQNEIQADLPKDEEGQREDSQQMARIVERVSNVVREQVDYIFASPVSEVVFGAASPLSSVKGVPYFERLLQAILPYIEKAIKAEQAASKARTAKYTAPFVKPGMPS